MLKIGGWGTHEKLLFVRLTSCWKSLAILLFQCLFCLKSSDSLGSYSFFGMHSYLEPSNPENSQRMMFYPLNPSSLLEIPLPFSLVGWMKTERGSRYKWAMKFLCLFLMFYFVQDRNHKLKVPRNNKMEQRKYVGREKGIAWRWLPHLMYWGWDASCVNLFGRSSPFQR